MRSDLALFARTGSHAYGTQREDSDDDFRGVFVAPRRDLYRLKRPAETFDRQDPDVTLHELTKFCKLAASCNPTVLEVLWVEPLHASAIGRELIGARDLFLSRRAMQTYGGYARQQLERAVRGTGGSRGQQHFRREKFLLHTMRLLDTGLHLLRTGEVKVRVDDPTALWDRARQPLATVVEQFADLDSTLAQAVADSPLPVEPDWESIDVLLIRLREMGP
jgi:uncharacterized protein